MNNNSIDYDAVKAAVQAFLFASDTLVIGLKESFKTLDTSDEAYPNYEHSRNIVEEANRLNGKIQDFLGEIESMEEERKTYQEDMEAERKEAEERSNSGLSFNTCRICMGDVSEHNWEAHTAEMRAESAGY